MTVSNSTAALEPYVLLRAALALFQKTPDALDQAERSQLETQAKKEQDIESLILRSPEAGNMVVSKQEIDHALAEIKQRFDDESSFDDELTRNGLNIDMLIEALQRQCKVENVMDLVASRAAKISEIEVGIYYYEHPDKFKQDEHRSARHILVTINEEMVDNTRDKAMARINLVASKLHRNPDSFNDLAMRYSECPTALQNGELGSVPKGRLYPELDAALFNMREGQLSDVIETEIGFHILLCEQIHPKQEVSLKQAAPQIQVVLEERAKRVCQRAWLAELASTQSNQHK